ncbi:LTA synthase family protein [Paenibacillus sp. 1P07SE]|uniref:LTA synthase family protein n=1 Tax=Paenibacillus sp. 1P07SE TaxID=3132209 RepID=UPI0039A6E2B1
MTGKSVRGEAAAWLPLGFMSVILMAKSLVAWQILFDMGGSIRPWLTDLVTIALLLAVIELAAVRGKLVLYLAVDLVLTTVYFASIMYYHYYGVVVTHHALGQINQITAVQDSVFSLLHPEYLLLYADLPVLATLLFIDRRGRRWLSRSRRRLPVLSAAAAAAVLSAVCAAHIGAHRSSINELVQASGMGLLNYEVYRIALERPEPLIPAEQITPAAIAAQKGLAGEPALYRRGQARGKNIILIQLEAFQNFLLHLKVDGKAVTPVMNALAEKYAYFPNFYQQVGQGNTSDAEFVVNTSYYIPSAGAASQIYGGKQLPGLPRLLREAGYYSATFHANDVAFWSRDRLYSALGFDAYYDKSFFGEADKVAFGASDEVLYRRIAPELSSWQQAGLPFYAHIITMSAHHPFRLPEDKRLLSMPAELDGTLLGDYLTAQHYADRALGQFIEELQRSGIWEDSVVAVYGDHLGLPMYALADTDKRQLEQLTGHPYSYPDMLNIPLVISVPGQTGPQRLEQAGGQVDLLPTLAHLLALDSGREVWFGQDLLEADDNVLPQRYYLPTGSLVTDGAVFIPGRGYDDGVTLPIRQVPGAASQPRAYVTEADYYKALRLLHLSDSYVRQLPEL